MIISDAFAWSPYVALALGALAGLGALRSRRAAGLLAGVAMLAQVVGWMALFVAAEVGEHGWDERWQDALFGGFLWGLLVALPYTIIGAAVVGGLVALVCSRRDRGKN